MFDDYLGLLDMCYEELEIALQGLEDEHVWLRPASGLLSIGEIVGHVAHWDAVRFAGEAGEKGWPDLAKCRIQSPLVDECFQYYTGTIGHEPACLNMSAAQLSQEVMRIHKESMSQLKAANPELDAAPTGWAKGGPSGNTLRDFLKYQIFHVSYHTGQIYSARHLLGETPPDN